MKAKLAEEIDQPNPNEELDKECQFTLKILNTFFHNMFDCETKNLNLRVFYDYTNKGWCVEIVGIDTFIASKRSFNELTTFCGDSPIDALHRLQMFIKMKANDKIYKLQAFISHPEFWVNIKQL